MNKALHEGDFITGYQILGETYPSLDMHDSITKPYAY